MLIFAAFIDWTQVKCVLRDAEDGIPGSPSDVGQISFTLNSKFGDYHFSIRHSEMHSSTTMVDHLYGIAISENYSVTLDSLRM